MDRRATDWPEHAELVGIVRQVRRRWRIRVVLRGMVAILGAALAVFLVSAFVVDRLAFSPGAVIAARLAIGFAVVGLLLRFLFVPLRRPVTDEQVALYLEENEPTLRSSLISALTPDGPEPALSPALARRTIEIALQRCRAVEEGRRIERKSLQKAYGLLSGVALAGLLLFLVGPAFVRFGARAIFLPLRSAEAALLYRVAVEPGDISLARGADLPVSAILSGFTSDRVDLVFRMQGDSVLQRVPMLSSQDSDAYEVRLFDITEAAEYYVEAGSVRSPVFHVSVLEVPYVDEMDLELHFPAYTGLEPRVIEDGGDLAAPTGTTVRVRATPTLPVTAGRVVLSDGRTLDLAADSSGVLTGEFQVRASGLYHVELQSGTGELVAGSPQYLIDVLDDMDPSVQLSKPGRDTRVTAVDEVFLEAKAEDDYGVRSLDLVYSVNGGEEKTVSLYDGGRMPEVTAGHTIYLEEFGLQPGDFVSYYARATDVGPGDPKPVSSDIYFMEIRPFGRNYRQADAGGGGGGGGGQGEAEADGQLSQRQRELIAATFNMVRDRGDYSEDEFQENMVTLALAQEKLREQALTLAQRLSNRGVARDSAFRTILQALPLAAAEMTQAAEELRAIQPPDALPPEQRALLQLQRAEAAYREVQVRLGQEQGGGGGGGGGSPTAEDLADLFGLELEQLQNQYETVERGSQESQQAQSEIDQTADKVKELARRLERENERMREAMASQVRDGSSAANQRDLAAQTEEAARQLERLSREQRRPDLAETARRLREAADAMRRAAADGRNGNAGANREALDRLREATRRLDRSQQAGAQSEAQEIAQRARALAEEGREITEQMESLPDAGANRGAQAERLTDRKDEQAGEVAELQREIEELAAETRREQPDASRRLQQAAESVKRNDLPRVIRDSRAATQPNAPREYVRRMEEQINEGLDELQRRTEEASRSFSQPQNAEGAESLDRARDLVRGLESMQERTRQAMGTQMSNRQGSQDGPGGQPQGGGDQGGEEGGTQPSGRLGDRPGGQQQGQGEQQAEGQQGQGQQGEGQQGQGQGQQGQGQGQQGQGEGQQGQGEGQQGQGQGQQGQGEGQQGQGQGQQGQGQQGEGQGQQGQGQGGEGQGGQDGQSGRRLGQGPGGTGFNNPGTGWSNGGPAAGSPDPEAVRQLRSEVRQRIEEARELRGTLAEQGLAVQELDRAIAQLAEMDDQRVYADWDELQHLQAAVVDRLKEFEFTLRQTVEGGKARQLFLSGSGDVPPAYREMVERYYRDLSDREEQ
jgi:hypothetical protein